MAISDFLNAWSTSAIAALLALLWWVAVRKHANRRYLPGPKPRPIIGNVPDLPKPGHEWLGYADLSRKYGSDILYFTAFGAPLVVINSFEPAHELLDKRGALYSDRPRLVMIKELMGWSWNLVVMSYGKLFTAHRRIVQQEFQQSVVAKSHRPVMNREVVALLDRLLTTPGELVQHLRLMSAAIIMMVTYGHQVESSADEYVEIAEAVRDNAEDRPGVEPVDVLPILKYLPAWFPGGGFQRLAAISRALSVRMLNIPFDNVKKRMAEGTAVESMATRLLNQDDLVVEGIEREAFIKNCCGVVYSAGADTIVAALRNFTLAMLLYPDVQKRAHEELDRVLGRDRLPTVEDRARLPYVSYIAKEALRWKAVSALGVPHFTIDKDEYRGGYVPKGTTVIANLHAMLHDPSVYSRPDEFFPERYAPTPENPEGEPDPNRAAFGFGRRICPGRFFAEDSLFVAIAGMLHVFALSIPENADRAAVEVRNIKWTSGLVSHPSDFPFKLTPRFEGAPALVRSMRV